MYVDSGSSSDDFYEHNPANTTNLNTTILNSVTTNSVTTNLNSFTTNLNSDSEEQQSESQNQDDNNGTISEEDAEDRLFTVAGRVLKDASSGVAQTAAKFLQSYHETTAELAQQQRVARRCHRLLADVQAVSNTVERCNKELLERMSAATHELDKSRSTLDSRSAHLQDSRSALIDSRSNQETIVPDLRVTIARAHGATSAAVASLSKQLAARIGATNARIEVLENAACVLRNVLAVGAKEIVGGVSEAHTCPLCLTQHADMCCTPCGHVICITCTQALKKNSNVKCGMCRARVTGFIKLFFAF